MMEIFLGDYDYVLIIRKQLCINDFFIQEENMTYLDRAMHELIKK